MTLLRRAAIAGAATLGMVGSLIAAAPAHATLPGPRADLTVRANDPGNALPARFSLHIVQSSGGAVVQDISVRADRATNKLHVSGKYRTADENYFDILQGYDGTREYSGLPPGSLNAAQLRALKAAGKPGPYYTVSSPAPPSPSLFGFIPEYSPVDAAKAAVAAVTDGDVQRLELPSGKLLFMVANLPGGAKEDFLVDRSGALVSMWRYNTGSSIFRSDVTGRGAAVSLAMPKGDALTLAIVNAALAAYPRNVATSLVVPKAAAVAKAVNKWAKKKHVTVTAKVIRKRAGKAISGFTVSKNLKGVKIAKAYVAVAPPTPAPAGTVARCLVAKHRKAVVVTC